MRSPEEIKAILEDDKSGLRESIVRSIGTRTVVLFAISDSKEGDLLELGGTGTLVTIANYHYILTAAHVWEERLKSSRQVGITLKEDIDHCCSIDTGALIPFGPPKPQIWNEWGPDLVFLRIPNNHVGGIEAFQSFYPLDRERPRVTMKGVETRILMGAPRASGNFTRTHAELSINGFFSDIEAPTYTKGNLDYVDLKEDVSIPGVPQSFGGVSGGGLWRVQVFESPQTAKIDWSWFLEGVAFYQLELTNSHRVIRCHGQQSIRVAMRELQPKSN